VGCVARESSVPFGNEDVSAAASEAGREASVGSGGGSRLNVPLYLGPTVKEDWRASAQQRSVVPTLNLFSTQSTEYAGYVSAEIR
jgi:hypothetical protein